MCYGVHVYIYVTHYMSHTPRDRLTILNLGELFRIGSPCFDLAAPLRDSRQNVSSTTILFVLRQAVSTCLQLRIPLGGARRKDVLAHPRCQVHNFHFFL
jgi:hypothetical protein